MKGLKKLLPIGLVVALLLVLSPTAVLADQTVQTTFSGNDTPAVVVALTGDLTPQSEATIDVTVTDADGYADIASVVLKLYLDADISTDKTEFDTKTTADAETLAYITWNGTTFELSEEASSTWAMGTCATPTDSLLTNPFVFKITPSKVATEALNSGTACWQIAVLVTDDQAATGFGSDASRAAMAWYGEISTGDNSADFGIVTPGTVFASATVGNLSMTYIANGPYDEKVKVATDAFTGGTGTVTVDVTDFDAIAANEVAFMADDDATTAGYVGVNAAGATIDDSGTITTEAGDTVAVNSLWLQMSSSYTATGVKTGNIYYVISDGS